MQIAAFESEPEAQQTATILKEQGYDCTIVTRNDRSYEQRTADYFKGKAQSYQPQAYVISETAEFEPFLHAAQRHYGFVIRGDIA